MTTLAWGYSAPPLRLAARGLGELATALVVTLCVPLLGYYLQAGELDPRIFAACLLPCVLQFAMLLAIELPDAAGDAVAGKRTLVVRLGAAAGARLYAGADDRGLRRAAAAGPGRAAGACRDGAAGRWRRSRSGRRRASFAAATRDPARWDSVAFWSVALLAGSAGAALVAAVTLALRLRGG